MCVIVCVNLDLGKEKGGEGKGGGGVLAFYEG